MADSWLTMCKKKKKDGGELRVIRTETSLLSVTGAPTDRLDKAVSVP